MAVSVRPAAPWGKGYEPWPPAGDVSLDDLDEAVRAAYGDLGEEVGVDLDRETRNELAMLVAATGADPESSSDGGSTPCSGPRWTRATSTSSSAGVTT